MRFIPVVGLFLLLLCAAASAGAQTRRFVMPVAGAYGPDYKIINYVDWAADTFYKDGHCNTKTYDGHQGTDFCIRNFRKMDSGVDVMAADNGRVIFVQDGLYDRNKISVVSRGLGNYVGIKHSGKLFTYYAHLRKNSITVHTGDSVVAGQKLGLVGASGNASDPHLHFELWYDSSYYIDPFSGPCGNAGTYWLNEPAYDTSFGLWTSGMCNYPGTLDTLREEPKRLDTFYLRDAAITYWSILYGMRLNDSISIEWYTPGNALWSNYGYRLSRDWWYYYYWSYLTPSGSMAEGRWTLKVLRNGVQVATRPFYFSKQPTAIRNLPAESRSWSAFYDGRQVILRGLSPGDAWYLSDIAGRVRKTGIAGESIVQWNAELPAGIYIATVMTPSGARSFVRMAVW